MIVDTNVAVVANERTPQASPTCVLRSVEALVRVRDEQRLLLDQIGLVFDQYRTYFSFSGQPGPGDAFFQWVFDNRWNEEYVRQVDVTMLGENQFAEFPEDPALTRFDPGDRVFVAVALASGESPPILNAADSDWWNYRDALAANGVTVEFLCPELMTRER